MNEYKEHVQEKCVACNEFAREVNVLCRRCLQEKNLKKLGCYTEEEFISKIPDDWKPTAKEQRRWEDSYSCNVYDPRENRTEVALYLGKHIFDKKKKK